MGLDRFSPTNPLDEKLIIEKTAAHDSAGLALLRNDTLKFSTKTKEDYGRLILRFTNLDLKQHPVLQFVSGDKVAFAYPLTTNEYVNNLFTPGEYIIRILYDTDANMRFTQGNFTKKQQPETVIVFPQKLVVRADWDNENDINL